MFAPDQGDRVAEARLVLVDQPGVMGVFLSRYCFECSGRARKIGTQPLGIAAIDLRVLFLARDCEGKDFLL